MDKKKIGIIGATGYTGSELVRILHHHPHTEIAVITSESRAGEKFSDVHPFFAGIVDQELKSVEDLQPDQLDLVFLALPHGVSMDFVKRLKNRIPKIVDLSGDFRLSSPEVYEEWYQKDHIYPEGFKDAVFGLPELFGAQVKKAGLVANPGCYPTGAILGLAPLLKRGFVDTTHLIVDSKSGVTGAGVKAKPVTHFASVNDNFKAYGLKKHRHSIEIQEVSDRIADKATMVQFTPHLLPVDRGILSTIYARPSSAIDAASLRGAFNEFYADAPFVRIRDQVPAIKDVRGTNLCDIYTDFDPRTGNIIVITTIDNLVKGAAGQAVQNMNLMFGLDESSGLHQIPVHP